jgi:hypothetical protein
MKTILLSPTLLIAASLVSGGFQQARGSVSYGSAGSTYSQNFDSLPNTPQNTSLGNSPLGWTDDNASPGAGNFSIVGWYLFHPTLVTEGGFNGHERFRNGSGSSGTGSFYSFGTSGSTERALGDVGANTLAPDGQTGNDAGNLYIALRLSNNSGQTLDSFTLNFTGEQWRDSGTSTPETMTLGWSTTAAAVSDPSALFNNVAALAWTSPTATATAGALDGNAAANRVVLAPVTVTGLNWLPGTDLWLRWTDPQLSGKTDEGMSIDDLSFSADIAVPEPSAGLLFGIGLLAFNFLHPRKRN